jgi:archaellum component FlaF (FlaF/FlaG flagellin family)
MPDAVLSQLAIMLTILFIGLGVLYSKIGKSPEELNDSVNK